MTARNPLSFANLQVIDADPLEQIEAAVAGGFDAVGLRIIAKYPTDIPIPIVGNKAMLQAIRHRLDIHGLFVLDAEVFRMTEDVDIDAKTPILETVAELGAHYLLFVNEDTDESRASENIGRLAEKAAPYKIKPMLEFVSFYPTGTVEAAARLIERSGHANAGVMLDPLHLSRSGGTPDDLRKLNPALFDYCQFCDAPPPTDSLEQRKIEGRQDREFPGDGVLPLAGILDALPQGIPLSVETPRLRDKGLSPAERARLCGEATRKFLRSVGRL